MLAIAKSMMTARPRRSVLFVWHDAEEKGLLGSEHFAANPTVPIDSIVAMINMDMIGRRGGPTAKFDSRTHGAAIENTLYVLGPNSAPNNLSRTFGAIFDTVNARQVRPFTIDRAFDNPSDPEKWYERSDHINYAKKGIPILFFSTGFHEDYHKVTDEVGKIDFDKMSRIGGLLLELGTTIANREGRPR
jgi:Zn-dependent M28 family amino/carboxypeptidase